MNFEMLNSMSEIWLLLYSINPHEASLMDYVENKTEDIGDSFYQLDTVNFFTRILLTFILITSPTDFQSYKLCLIHHWYFGLIVEY